MAQVINTVSPSSGVALEKAGVIAGFVTGLAVGVGLVGRPLLDAGVPEPLVVALVVAVVAACTRLGLSSVQALTKNA
jgi:hypothetical protein